jgi:hypothetical protein
MTKWHFRTLHPNDNSGTSTVEDNFANEERSSVEILVRETLQNPLDARQDSACVRVRYDLVSIDAANSEFAKALFSTEFRDHSSAAKLTIPSNPGGGIEFLTIEDFGTSGLEGNYSDSSIDGATENWNAFWFREGEGAKPTKSNGGAGQGKVTLYTSSRIRTVLALTKRVSDQRELLLGCCKFRQNYKNSDISKRWAKEALWGQVANDESLVAPVQDIAFLQLVQSDLRLQRQAQCGTTFIVPFPNEIALDAIKIAVINEFYYPIKRGRLQVDVGEVSIDSLSIAGLAKNLGDAGRHKPHFLSFIDQTIEKHLGREPTATAKETWTKEAKLTEDCFAHAELETLREAFKKSEIVSVDFPVQIRKKGVGDTAAGVFRVVLRQDLDGDQSHELFVRQDLCIDSERRLKGSRQIQPVLALTLIDDESLSTFLATAEEPTHRLWNARRPKVIAQYVHPEKVLNAVRNAALRLIGFLTPPGLRDETALSIYFADPVAEPGKRKGAVGNETKTPLAEPGGKLDIPPPQPKAVEFSTLKDGFKVWLRDGADVNRRLPLSCRVEVAYATTFGDPFSQWDAAEFWLNDANTFRAQSSGVEKLVRDGNLLTCVMASPKAAISLTGFDPNRQLEVRINYQEELHGTDE